MKDYAAADRRALINLVTYRRTINRRYWIAMALMFIGVASFLSALVLFLY